MRTLPALVALLASSSLLRAPALAQCGGPDPLEQNDDCAHARETEHGAPDLSVYKTDPDWYRLRVPPQGTVTVDVLFHHAVSNVDVRLWDACGGAVVAEGNTVDDDERVSAVNHSDAPVDFFLEVFVNPASSGTCNDYDMEVEGVSQNIGANECQSAVNSTGFAATMSAEGSLSVAANDVTLYARPVPALQAGVFYYGPQQIEIPFGNGWRCVGPGPIGTFFLPLRVSNAAGELVTRIDLAHPPERDGRILAGSTWHFQAWFRDPAAGGHAFSLSDGLKIVFQP